MYVSLLGIADALYLSVFEQPAGKVLSSIMVGRFPVASRKCLLFRSASSPSCRERERQTVRQPKIPLPPDVNRGRLRRVGREGRNVLIEGEKHGWRESSERQADSGGGR